MDGLLARFLDLSGTEHAFLQWFVLAVPVFAFMSYRHLRQGRPLSSKTRRFATVICVQAVGLVLTLAAARAQLRPWIRVPDVASVLFAGVLTTILVLGATRGWARAPEGHRERLKLLYMPEKPAHFALAAVLATLAGVGEELAYRGALYLLLLRLGAPALLAVLVCSVVFALAHIAQGWRGFVGTMWIALIFHLMVIANNSLVPAMFTHTTYDLVTILGMPRREARRLARRSAAAG